MNEELINHLLDDINDAVVKLIVQSDNIYIHSVIHNYKNGKPETIHGVLNNIISLTNNIRRYVYEPHR